LLVSICIAGGALYTCGSLGSPCGCSGLPNEAVVQLANATGDEDALALGEALEDADADAEAEAGELAAVGVLG
jgi:hypothetical protein